MTRPAASSGQRLAVAQAQTVPAPHTHTNTSCQQACQASLAWLTWSSSMAFVTTHPAGHLSSRVSQRDGALGSRRLHTLLFGHSLRCHLPALALGGGSVGAAQATHAHCCGAGRLVCLQAGSEGLVRGADSKESTAGRFVLASPPSAAHTGAVRAAALWCVRSGMKMLRMH